jgi:tetratricopeptide (TPR) repeat protein
MVFLLFGEETDPGARPRCNSFLNILGNKIASRMVGEMMVNKLVSIGNVKFTSKTNTNEKVFFRLPFVTTISKVTASDLNEKGNRFFDKKDYDKALKYYEKALKMPFHPEPNNCGLIMNLAQAHVKKKEYGKAREYSERLLEASELRNRLVGQWYLANIYYEEGNYEKSIEHFTKLLAEYNEKDGPRPLKEIKHNMACSYHRMGKPDEALKLDPDLYKQKPTNFLTHPGSGIISYYIPRNPVHKLTQEDINTLLGG